MKGSRGGGGRGLIRDHAIATDDPDRLRTRNGVTGARVAAVAVVGMLIADRDRIVVERRRNDADRRVVIVMVSMVEGVRGHNTDTENVQEFCHVY